MYIPNASLPDIAGGPLVQKIANLLQFTSASTRVVQQVAELAGIGLDLDIVLLVTRIALQDQDLMLGPAFLAYSIH